MDEECGYKVALRNTFTPSRSNIRLECSDQKRGWHLQIHHKGKIQCKRFIRLIQKPKKNKKKRDLMVVNCSETREGVHAPVERKTVTRRFAMPQSNLRDSQRKLPNEVEVFAKE